MINSITVSGNLGAQPELRYTQSGKAVASARIAVWQGKETDACWLEVTFWEGTAELFAKLPKGQGVIVSGRIGSRQWEGKNGPVTTYTITGSEFGIAPKRDAQNQSRAQAAARQTAYGSAAGNSQSAAPAWGAPPPEDDAIPF